MKELFKGIAEFLATVLGAGPALCCRLAGATIGAERAFPGWSQAVALLPGISGCYVRRAFYRLILPQAGQGCVISFGTIFSHSTASIGHFAYVGPYCSLGDVEIEADVLIGSHVSIINGCHQHGIERLDVPVREQPGRWPRIRIGQDTWIGDRAVVMADVGQHCVVGAGAVVTKPVPDYAIVVGNPARIVGSRLVRCRSVVDDDENTLESLEVAVAGAVGAQWPKG